MWSTQRSVHLSLLVLLFTSFTSAWPWPPVDGEIMRRQDGGSNTDTASASSAASNTAAASTSGTITASASLSSGGSSPSGSSGSQSQSGSGSGKESGSGKPTPTSDSEGNSTVVDPRLPAGGVSMITPAPISGAQYYKVGDYVTFAWNYTSLSVTPSAIDVIATRSGDPTAWTLISNQSVAATGNITWDTSPYAMTTGHELLTDTYTLLIYDADAGISATAKAGYLGVYNQFTFGMYTPQPPTPFASFVCAACSGAGSLSATEWHVIKVAMGMSLVTVLSFTWFVRGLGIFV